VNWAEDAAGLARAWDDARSRSQQTQPGWSNMTDCRRELGYNLAGEWPTDDTDKWPAVAGTALHGWWTHVRRAHCHAKGIPVSFGVPVIYRGIPGRADEVLWPAEPGGRWSVTDWKFPGLASIDLWADDQFLHEMFVQPNGYAAGVLELGTDHQFAPPEARGNTLDEDACTVRLLGMPVGSGTSFDRWQGHERPFSRESADDAADRLADVQAALDAGEELPRDKPPWWCERFCQFVSLCRGFDRDLGKGPLPLVEDAEMAAAIRAYGLAGELIGANKKIQKELRPALEGARGVTADGWKVFRAAGNPGKMEYDDELVEHFLGRFGAPVSEVMRPGPPGSPKLTVKRS
jgi:hypothetical protein